jgi:non-ribosomal peptide synthetase component F
MALLQAPSRVVCPHSPQQRRHTAVPCTLLSHFARMCVELNTATTTACGCATRCIAHLVRALLQHVDHLDEEHVKQHGRHDANPPTAATHTHTKHHRS